MKYAIITLIVYMFLTVAIMAFLKGASKTEPREEYEIHSEETNQE